MLKEYLKDFKTGYKLGKDITSYLLNDEDIELINGSLYTRYLALTNSEKLFELMGYLVYKSLNKGKFNQGIEKWRKTNK